MRAAADIAFDYGRSKHANEEGSSSTIVDLGDWTVIGTGVEYERLARGFKDRRGVELAIAENTAGP